MNEREHLPIMRTNRNDINDIFSMFAALQALTKASKDMEKRFRSIPNGWRDLKMCMKVLDKLVKAVLETVPLEKLESMNRMLPRMKFKLICGAQASELGTDECIVSDKDINVLTIRAHEQCKMCFDQECRKCDLGRTLDSILTYDRNEGSWADVDLETLLTEDT